MKKILLTATLLLFSACLLRAADLPGLTAPSYKITKVLIEGASKANREKISSVMTLKEQKEYTDLKASADLKKIFELGLFSDVELLKDYAVEGMEVIVRVKERPLLREIKYPGAKEIGAGKLESLAEFKKGDIFNLNSVKEAVEKILAHYKENSFYLAEVTYSVKEIPAENAIDLSINVKEGRRMYVSKINFTGIKVFTEKDLKGKMETTEAGFLVSGTLNDDTLAADMEKITRYYKSEGFINAKVLSKKVRPEESGEKIYIDIEVSEGEQFKLGEVKITVANEKIVGEAEIRQNIVLKPGDVFNQEVFERDLNRVRFLFSEKGYIETNVEEEIIPDNEKKLVFASIKIDEGSVFYIDSIKVEGNYKTKDNVILRELRIKQGEAFDSLKIRRSLENIYNLGFFEDVVPLVLPGSSPDKREIVISVKERPTGMINVGAGYNSLDGLTGTLAVTENNLFGEGQRLSVSWEFGSARQTYSLSFFEPYFFSSGISAGVSIYDVLRAYYSDYKDRRIGGNMKFGFPLSDEMRLWLTYKYEQVDIYDVASTASNLIRNVEGVNDISSINAQMVIDTRDSIFFNTKKGNRLSFSVEYAGGLLLGSTNFTKYTAEYSTFHKVVWDFVFALRIMAGYTTGFGNTPDVPFYEKFFAGGSESVRGYGERVLSPADVNGSIVGGNFMSVGNAELRFPIYGPLMGVTFFDFGKSWQYVSDFDITRLPASLGLGIRVMLGGAMMIRIDYAYGFDPAATRGGQIHFSMGNIF